MKRLLLVPVVVLAVALVAALSSTAEDEKPARDPGWKDGYRGAESCRPCHAKEYAEWVDSAHAKSTRPATAETLPKEIVEGGSIAHGPGSSRFYREGDTFFIETMGPDGERASYPITHVVGQLTQIANDSVLERSISFTSGHRVEFFDRQQLALRSHHRTLPHRATSSPVARTHLEGP